MRCRGAWVARPRRRREGWGVGSCMRARVVWVLYARAVEGRAAVGAARYDVEL